MEAKCFEANKTSLELLHQIRDLNQVLDQYEAQTNSMKEQIHEAVSKHVAESQTLQTYIVDLKTRILQYTPVKGDPLDLCLADFINNHPNRKKLKI